MERSSAANSQFREATFSGDAWFEGATFGRNAQFELVVCVAERVPHIQSRGRRVGKGQQAAIQILPLAGAR